MKKILLVPIIIFISISLNGCNKDGSSGSVLITGKLTGGGWIVSASDEPGEKANFGFNVAKCEVETPVSGRFTFHDKSAPNFFPGGVKMKGEIESIIFCDDSGICVIDDCPEDSYEARISYISTNPKLPGDGIAYACVIDNGEGANAILPDEGIIEVKTGPFQDYINLGPVQGNIQFHTCTCTDGVDNNQDGLIDEDDLSCIDPDTGLFDPNGDEE